MGGTARPHYTSAVTYELPAIGRPPQPPPLDKIAVEEHFSLLHERDLQALVRSMDYDGGWMQAVSTRLTEFDADRLAGMDASGISMAVLSHTVPGVQGIVDRAAAATAAREINDFVADVIARHPTRFAGFASIALQDAD